jgi:hypothetical protein
MDLVWETASESDVAGFHVYRSTSSSSDGDRLNEAIIMAKGSPATGAVYEFVDEPENSGRYYYKITEVSLSTGDESPYLPSSDLDGEPAYDDFIKVFEHTENDITGGEYYWFNDGSQDNPGDGRKLSIIITATGISGSITVKQTNAEPPNAPNWLYSLWRWEISSDLPEQASIDFFYNEEDLGGVDENADYIGIARFDETTNSWKWVGGTVYSTNHKVRLDDAVPQGYYVLYKRIFGDITGDGYVGAADLQRFGDVWLQESSDEFSAGSDARFFNYNKNTVNGKQIINAGDLQIFGDNWLNGTPK